MLFIVSGLHAIEVAFMLYAVAFMRTQVAFIGELGSRHQFKTRMAVVFIGRKLKCVIFKTNIAHRKKIIARMFSGCFDEYL